MKARVIKSFFDTKEGIIRNTQDEFIASKERVEQINSTLFGVLVEEIIEEEGAEIEKGRTIRSRKGGTKDNK